MLVQKFRRCALIRDNLTQEYNRLQWEFLSPKFPARLRSPLQIALLAVTARQYPQVQGQILVLHCQVATRLVVRHCAPRAHRQHGFPPTNTRQCHRGWWRSCGNCHLLPRGWESARSSLRPAPHQADTDAQDNSMEEMPNHGQDSQKDWHRFQKQGVHPRYAARSRANVSHETASPPDPSHGHSPCRSSNCRAEKLPPIRRCRFDCQPFDKYYPYAGHRLKARP